ncbi:MAG: M23 family metallopeptidase, partial [bacterium]
MKGFLCFALLFLTNLSAIAQEYLWPTDASQFITSSFCESRSRRFHAAIDVKTWNQTGYKIFAVRSGYIERMAISPFGYGRVLYLRLDNGETAVYAHLEAFNENLQAVAEQEQERVGRYRIDKFFRPGMLPVQKGEVIGYTGQTGIGTPHLHFELRDNRSRPINPFLRGFEIVDTV